MKKLFTIFILFVSIGLSAQHEVLSPLTTNPKLTTAAQSLLQNNHRYIIDQGNIIVKTDTLTLPFVDDFSRDRTRSHKWIQNHITDTFYNAYGGCLGNEGIPLQSARFMFDTAYTYVWNAVDQRIDSFPIAPIQFTSFGVSSSACLANTPSLVSYWPVYYVITAFDTAGVATDSIRADSAGHGSQIIDYAPVLYFAQGEPGTLWFDNYAFINNTYPILPPTIGVATLDGLNEFGFPYNNSTQYTYGFADKLTSNPINMEGLVEGDSVYLSFFYEAQGLGEAPNAVDSLFLEFKDLTGSWYPMWSIPGITAGGLAPQTFQQVLVNVPELAGVSTFFHSTFQFRFRNKASLYGNLDHWHIDYVRLAKNRNANDTTIRDISFVYPFPTILKNFTQLPADQLSASDLVDTIHMLIRNLDPDADNNPPATNFLRNAAQVYPTPGPITSDVFQTFNARSFYDMELYPSSEYSVPTVEVDSLVIVSNIFLDANDTRKTNDTMIQGQEFSTVMAYDDGTAEASYGLTGIQFKKFAYEFNVNKPDTLVGFQIMYTQIEQDVSNMVFNISLWDSLKFNDNNFTGTPILSLTGSKPRYIDSINGFATYVLDTTIIVDDKIYLGWEQNNTETRSVQIGFDLNSPLGKPHMYIFTFNNWHASNITTLGSPMMRLIFDSNYWGTSGIEEQKENDALFIYPNPAYDYLSIRRENNHNLDITILNTVGQTMLHEAEVGNRLNIANLSAGVYLILAHDPLTGKTYRNKFVKAAE